MDALTFNRITRLIIMKEAHRMRREGKITQREYDWIMKCQALDPDLRDKQSTENTDRWTKILGVD